MSHPVNDNIKNWVNFFRGEDSSYTYRNLLLESQRKILPINYGDLPENLQEELRRNPKYSIINATTATKFVRTDLLSSPESCQISFCTPINPTKFSYLNENYVSKIVTLDCIVVSIFQPNVQALNYSGNGLFNNDSDYKNVEWEDVQFGRIEEKPQNNKKVNAVFFTRSTRSNQSQFFKCLNIILRGQLVNSLHIGQDVTINGIFTNAAEGQNGDKRKCVNFYIEVIGICFRIEKISELISIKSNDLLEYYAKLIAPNVIGKDKEKQAILCQLVGGITKSFANVYYRGNIHILLIGSPGVAKSQILQFVQKILPNSFFVSGPSSSAAGVATAITQSKGQFKINYGILPKAENGIVCIDEYDKMSDADRPAVKEVMDHQTISIAKASNCTVIKAQCAILAAANFPLDKFDELDTLYHNLTSGFDVVLKLIDNQNVTDDHKLGNHIIDMHNKQPESNSSDNFKLLRDFVNARRNDPAPKYCDTAKEKLKTTYVLWRKHNTFLTIRHLSSLIRMSEAIAKISRTDVTVDCVEKAKKFFDFIVNDGLSVVSKKFA